MFLAIYSIQKKQRLPRIYSAFIRFITRHCNRNKSIQYNNKVQHLKFVKTNSLALGLNIDYNTQNNKNMDRISKIVFKTGGLHVTTMYV
jgi:hypothetical protein